MQTCFAGACSVLCMHELYECAMPGHAHTATLRACMQVLTGDHGNTVAAFAVMLVEAGLLCVGGVERQWFAEARSEGAAERSGDVLAAAQRAPSTPAARHAWCAAQPLYTVSGMGRIPCCAYWHSSWPRHTLRACCHWQLHRTRRPHSCLRSVKLDQPSEQPCVSHTRELHSSEALTMYQSAFAAGSAGLWTRVFPKLSSQAVHRGEQAQAHRRHFPPLLRAPTLLPHLRVFHPLPLGHPRAAPRQRSLSLFPLQNPPPLSRLPHRWLHHSHISSGFLLVTSVTMPACS